MQEKLNQLKRNDIRDIAPHPQNKHDIITKNKVRLATKGYNQTGGIKNEEA